jgi:non-lysosomal glucosylceramidase
MWLTDEGLRARGGMTKRPSCRLRGEIVISHFRRLFWIAFVCLAAVPVSHAQTIPQAAWSRAIGEPLSHPGVKTQDTNVDDGYWQGLPVGGFGAGSIGRTYRGDFARWHLKVGVDKYESVAPDVFAAYEQEEGAQPVAVVLRAGKPKGKESLPGWNWNYPPGAGKYYALFPKAWFEYEYSVFPVQLSCEQFSPILPDNYRETSYPVGVFVWRAKNTGTKAVKVAILFSWANMVGWFQSFGHDLNPVFGSGDYNSAKEEKLAGGNTMKGIVFQRVEPGAPQTDQDGQFAIATIEGDGVTVTRQTTFDLQSDGSSVWKTFSQNGTLAEPVKNWLSSGSNPVGGAIAAVFTVQPGTTKEIPMALSWDFPIVQFGSGRRWYKRYTAFYGKDGKNAWNIARTALENYRKWSEEIDDWQRPIVNDASQPLWLRGMLLNELYDLVDGGTFWENGEVGKPQSDEPGTGAHHLFSYLECFDYPFYDSLDVRFYGSWALLKLWPELEKQAMREFADTVPLNYDQNQQAGATGAIAPRKEAGSLPHDLGSPIEDPIERVNQYNYQDVSNWKDLNTKYALLVYRDWYLTGANDRAFLKYTWPSVKTALDFLKKFDAPSDGLPQNEGIPDQTYDNWPMRGTSAYCGSLWLAAVKAAVVMADQMGDTAAKAKYQAWYDKAQPNFVKELWNGSYFNYDTGSPYKANIMADQLVGQWYADLTGLGNIVPDDMTRKTLGEIFSHNVMEFENGQMGAVNGLNPDGSAVTISAQPQEVWSGVTFALASLMKAEGMTQDADRTAWGIYNVVYVKKGYWFRTPEAWRSDGNYRASLYMRPLAVWSLEYPKIKPAAR